MNPDFHCHSTASDGTLAPEAVAEVGEAPDQLGLCISRQCERQDHVVIGMGQRRAPDAVAGHDAFEEQALANDPPIVAAAYSQTGSPNTYPTYDLLGRKLFIGFTANF